MIDLKRACDGKSSDDKWDALDVMLRFSDKLAQGYALKEAFYRFMAAPDRAEADRRLDRIVPPDYPGSGESCIEQRQPLDIEVRGLFFCADKKLHVDARACTYLLPWKRIQPDNGGEGKPQ